MLKSMFKIPKIQKKKTVIYIIVIIIMFSGTGFFIYKNFSLTSGSSGNGSDIFDSADLKKIDIDKKNGLNTKNGEKEKTILEYEIFNDPKFQALNDNSVSSTTKVNIGRENPFEPY